MMKNYKIMITGVGGQGTLLASRIIGNIGVKLGLDVKVSEVHGMAQRGGSVVTYVKMGTKVNSPIIEKGEAEVILCFEKLEAVRWMEYLKPEGLIIVNNQQIDPIPVILGNAEYPDEIIEKLESTCNNIKVANALAIAEEIGNLKTVNTIMIGILAKNMDIDKEIWIESLKETVKPKFIDINLLAFEKGYNI